MNLFRNQATPIRSYAPGIITPVMEQHMIINRNNKKQKYSLIWGAVNMVLLGIVWYDIAHTSPFYIPAILYFEYFLFVVFFLNTVYHFVSYVCAMFYVMPVMQSPIQQRCPDQVNQSPILFNSTLNSSLSSTPMNTTAISWRSNASLDNSSTNYILSPLSLPNYRSTPPSYQYQNNSMNNQSYSPMSYNYDNSVPEVINDEQSLVEYLKGYENYEKAVNPNTSTDQPASLLSTFWNYPVPKNGIETSPIIQKGQYQLSPFTHEFDPTSPDSPVFCPCVGSSSSSPSSKSDDKDFAFTAQRLGIEMWKRLHVNSVTLTQWNANIRLWLSQTIVERVSKEIEGVNDSLQKQGFSDVQIGLVGIERLRKAARMSPALQFIPTLSTLIPFLEVTANQDYLVKRIHVLAKGGCMSDFKWNGGTNYNGKEWNETLPTDSAIIMHFFITYMDSQLLPLPNEPDIKPFSGYHFIKLQERCPELNPKLLAIQHMSEKPPHYRVIAGEEIFEMVKGYNNLFHSILLFLYQVNKRESGMLGQINLGRSGINILWVIDN